MNQLQPRQQLRRTTHPMRFIASPANQETRKGSASPSTLQQNTDQRTRKSFRAKESLRAVPPVLEQLGDLRKEPGHDAREPQTRRDVLSAEVVHKPSLSSVRDAEG